MTSSPKKVDGLGLSLGATLASTPQDFFDNIQAFSQRGRKNDLRRILHDLVGRTPSHVSAEFFVQKNSTS